MVALDAKMSFDENALFSLPDISEMKDLAQEDPGRQKQVSII